MKVEGIEMRGLFLVLFFTVVMVSSVNAQSTLALQEKCTEGAKKWFFEHINQYGGKWGSSSTEDGLNTNRFQSHYNRKLDKCFIRIDWTYLPKGKDTLAQGIDVFDVFENKLVGSFSVGERTLVDFGNEELRLSWASSSMVSTVEKQRKFETLIKPYMEE